MPPSTLLVTGGAGFIGSRFVASTIAAHEDTTIVNLDALTYAGSLENLAELDGHPRHVFVHGDIGSRDLLRELFERHRPCGVVHFAAESHVDRSIDDPGRFVQTNVVGTLELLEAARRHHAATRDEDFRFVHVSTDEVYGELGPTGAFDEASPYAPRSPYAASKAGADHLVRAYFTTYGLPTIVTSCSNNYGPFQFPEKLVPLVTLEALEARSLPVYGDGQQVRDWVHVDDHGDALRAVLARGRPGETYAVGARAERTNLEIVHAICDALDARIGPPRVVGERHASHRELVTFVADRPGHDRRYAIDPAKIEREIGWKPRIPFDDGLRATVDWYLAHRAWCARTKERYGRERLGTRSDAGSRS